MSWSCHWVSVKTIQSVNWGVTAGPCNHGNWSVMSQFTICVSLQTFTTHLYISLTVLLHVTNDIFLNVPYTMHDRVRSVSGFVEYSKVNIVLNRPYAALMYATDGCHIYIHFNKIFKLFSSRWDHTRQLIARCTLFAKKHMMHILV